MMSENIFQVGMGAILGFTYIVIGTLCSSRDLRTKVSISYIIPKGTTDYCPVFCLFFKQHHPIDALSFVTGQRDGSHGDLKKVSQHASLGPSSAHADGKSKVAKSVR
jgi:hypothetical protein